MLRGETTAEFFAGGGPGIPSGISPGIFPGIFFGYKTDQNNTEKKSGKNSGENSGGVARGWFRALADENSAVVSPFTRGEIPEWFRPPQGAKNQARKKEKMRRKCSGTFLVASYR